MPTALRTYQRLRYERVAEAQRKGGAVRDMWHRADWAKVRADPALIRLPREDWLLRHDCEKHIRRLWARASDPACALRHEWLAAGADSDEFAMLAREAELPPTPAETPAEEYERRLE